MSRESRDTRTTLKFKGLQITAPKVSGNTSGEIASSTQAKKAPLENRKSAENLKLKLASAVSAKLAAANKDGRSPSTNIRGIEYLLQRKQQNDSKLNTKSLSLQKPLRNNVGNEVAKDGEKTDKNEVSTAPKTITKDRTAAQKSLLNALMSSRVASGTGRQNTLTTRLGTSVTGKAVTSTNNSVAERDSKSVLNNVAKSFPPKTLPKPNRNGASNLSKTLQESKTNIKSSVVSSKTTLNTNSDNTKRSPENSSENGAIKSSTSVGNENSGNNVRSFPQPFQGNNLRQSLRSSTTVTSSDSEVYKAGNLRKTFPKDKITGSSVTSDNSTPSDSGSEVHSVRRLSKTFQENRMNTTSNVDNNGIKSSSTVSTINEPSSSNNGGFVSGNKLIFEKEIQRKRAQILKTRESPENLKSVIGRVGAPKPVVAPKPNKVTRMNSKNDSNIPRKEDPFQESVLEQLEADIGNCKITAFKTMEDFSVLRMRIFRLQNEVELLKKEREKRAA